MEQSKIERTEQNRIEKLRSARFSPLRLRVRYSERFQCASNKCSTHVTCTLPKVVGFFRVLRFAPTRKLTGWDRTIADKEVKSQLL
jgi:hypothetical protein